MKTYLEEHSDATRIFPWLADASSSIHCLCVVGEMLLFPEDIVQFKQISSEMFRDELAKACVEHLSLLCSSVCRK